MKQKFARQIAIAAAQDILAHFVADRVILAGSLRRRKAEVGDIEILYIPKVETVPDPADLFGRPITKNHTDESLDKMLQAGLICPRENALLQNTWGPQNKYALHLASRIPIDFFATTETAWFNYLVCRTGPAELNARIARAAQAKGWHWHPYRDGFSDPEGRIHPVNSEQDVFRRAGLDYLEPWQRQ